MLVNYFDGLTPSPHRAQLRLNQGELELQFAGAVRHLDRQQVRVCELAQTAQPWIYFKDGSSVQIHQASETELTSLYDIVPGLRLNWLSYVERSTFLILALAVLLLSSAVWYYEAGMAKLSDMVVDHLPAYADQKLGDSVQRHLYADGTLRVSRLSQEFQDDFRKELTKYDFPIPLKQVNLKFAYMRRGQANALALPNKMIILTDDLAVKVRYGNQQNYNQRMTGLAGIIAHEMGHIHYRHGTHGLISFALNSVLSSFFMGDISDHLAIAALAIMQTGYSREMEQEADDYALQWLVQQGLSGEYSAHYLEEMVTRQADIQGKPPRWLRWLNTHPEDDERIAKWRKVRGQ